MVVDNRTRRERLIEDNLGLVHACARKFIDKGTEYDDLFQAGCVGLIKAADGFDEARGFAFSTYAVPAILGEIKRLFRDGGTVKVGRSLKEKARRAAKERQALEEKLGREPTIGELAETLHIDAAETAFVLNASLPAVSLTADEDNGGNQLDIPVPSPEDELSDTLALKKVVSELEERDRTLIELRYFSGLTQSAAAAQLGMTQVQVSRREKTILAAIRAKLTA